MVLDASAAVRTLDRDPAALGLRARLERGRTHAPHLFDAEIGHTLRRRALAGAMDARLAAGALLALSGLVDRRHAHPGLLRLAWRHRENVSFYDALYIALAAQLEMPLLTSDARLARAPGLPCRVELV